MTSELEALLLEVDLRRDDHLVFVGDLLDKGPDSPGTVRFCRHLRETDQRVTLIEGNHEEKHRRFRRTLAADRANAMKMTGAEEMLAITEALSTEDVVFLESAVPFFELPEHKALVVHGGILPTMTALPNPAWRTTGSKEEREQVQRLLRTRHVRGRPETKVTIEYTLTADEDQIDETIAQYGLGAVGIVGGSATLVRRSTRPAGAFVALGEERPGDPFWAEVYDGRFSHVFFGHTPFPKAESSVQSFPHASGLDLGCVFGGRLATAILEADCDPMFWSVPARTAFATSLWSE
jgi:hypothetical protein